MDEGRLRRVLHVAQFAFFKAPTITAGAMNLLARAEPDLQFTWVCDLTPEANRRAEILHWTTQDALRDIYDRHGIFLFPSFFEGFGKAFLEAMSRGLCVVASDVGGMHDLIELMSTLLAIKTNLSDRTGADQTELREASNA